MNRKELAILVDEWRRQLLPEWRVVLTSTPPPGEEDATDYFAISSTKADYQEIQIHFPADSLARSREEIEVTVVHELLHALTRPWRQQVEELSDHLPFDLRRKAHDARVHEEEQVVDRLARVLTGHQPFGTVT